jgi:hypothetical protein
MAVVHCVHHLLEEVARFVLRHQKTLSPAEAELAIAQVVTVKATAVLHCLR